MRKTPHLLCLLLTVASVLFCFTFGSASVSVTQYSTTTVTSTSTIVAPMITDTVTQTVVESGLQGDGVIYILIVVVLGVILCLEILSLVRGRRFAG